MPSPVSIVEVLADRVRRDGSRPLLTYYHPAKGERLEFSAKSFANWVDKTANLISEHVDDGVFVAGPLSVQHPSHWMSLIWPLATWQCALYYSAIETPPVPEECDLIVTGPQNPQPEPPGVTFACSLHPLALGLTGLPDGVLDYTTEALAQPDLHFQNPIKYHDGAWFDADGGVSLGEWLELPPQPGRVLVRPMQPRLVLSEAIARPVLGGGSAVIVDGPVTEEELARIIVTERIDAEVTDPADPGQTEPPPTKTGWLGRILGGGR